MLGNSLAIGVDLENFVKKTNFNYLEIGCYDGVNLAALSEKFPHKKIYGVDPFISDGHTGQEKESFLETQKQNLYKNIEDRQNIIFFEKTNENFLKDEINNFASMNISSVFIDGAHILKYIKVDIDIALECFKNNQDKFGYVIFHDVHVPDVLEAIEYFKEKYNCECVGQSVHYCEFKVWA